MQAPDVAGPGRPRNPDIEDRVFDAAIEIYSRLGWAGFNFEAITRATGIGKAAIYRRWPTRGELLAETMKARWGTVEDIDTGTLRADLLSLATKMLTRLTGKYGPAAVHMNADRIDFAEARAATDEYFMQEVRAGRRIVRRAVARGELPERTSPTLIIDLVVGGAQNHVLATPPSLRAEMEATIDKFAADLVDTVLRGTTAEAFAAAGEEASHGR